MNCPHCKSHMNITESILNDKSQVSFFQCTVCVAQHVSSQPLSDIHIKNSSPPYSLLTSTASQYENIHSL